jgi:hypothetical protein
MHVFSESKEKWIQAEENTLEREQNTFNDNEILSGRYQENLETVMFTDSKSNDEDDQFSVRKQ